MIPYIKENIKTAIENIKNASRKIKVLNTIELSLVVSVTILYYLTLPIESKRVVFIPKGSTSNALSYLNQNGYSLNLLDRVALFFIGYPQSGWMDMGIKSDDTKLTKFDFLYKITTSKAALATVVLIPGETYYFFLNELAEKLKLPREELFKVYNELAYKKDGNIIAQTYNLPIGMNPRDLILYLFQYTDEEYQKYSMKIFGKYYKQVWYKYIIIASVIQKESGSKAEMMQVSGVVYNRLAQKMKLQMDGTLNYGEFSHTKITPTMIANDETSYNTYKYAGIPTDPVCAVEFEAIKAAIFPAKNSYLFFMKKAEGGGHSFASSFEAHKANVATVVHTQENEKIIQEKQKEKEIKVEKTKELPKVNELKNTPKESKKIVKTTQKKDTKGQNIDKKEATSSKKKVENKIQPTKTSAKTSTKEKTKQEQPKQKDKKDIWKNI